ncbi:putative thiol oxidoreductase with 2 cytochrome c heme-binding site [Labilithrix luteola]|uniref:Putative thiol oxidoreductase with 2 cytochrome c heme-binding site n=1 Tax=Labilithrix luteola TaxID=1391654 RepID=A0A0K1PMV6_9BACT|nr:di-heme oxidoredictase family protein [Labilithrix luteola]AKU94863.1 putative thiol oxidoreductase with 2 cytochrome c heme-binding site [Labilithrix luteola]
MKATALGLSMLVVAGVAACASETSSPDAPPSADPFSGGATTVFDATKDAYGNQAANLKGDRANGFNLGHAIFTRNWVTAPATTEDMDGLGPLFNQRSCSGCHARDGRAAPFDAQNNLLGMLFRLSVPGADEHGGPLGDPTYGGQVRPNGILGVPGDGTPRVSYDEKPGTYPDGTPYSLQVPRYSVEGWNYGPPSADLMISPRVAPATIGLGLLEAISENDLLANVRNGDPDGVVGKPNHVWDVTKKATAIGRFGWKANVPTVYQQTAGAFVGDMGITSTPFPEETCTAPMEACKNAPSGGSPEIDDDKLAAVVFYMRTLAVPARRAVSDPTALHGEALFDSFRCSTCHVTTFRTASFDGLPEVSGQTIHPYTDLLLHDMGPDLADNRPDYQATGTEWRTPPLWGIGLLKTVNGHDRLLHDGRARGLEEAILWHGGEATASRERFRSASREDREALLAFLRSL